MMTYRTRVLAIVAIGLLAAAPFPGSQLWAQHSPPPPVLLPVPQLTIPQPGNPVQQLSPSLGTGSQVYSVPRVYADPEPSPDIVAGRSRHHSARHRHVSRSHAGGSRPSELPRARAR